MTKIRYAQVDTNGLCNAGCWFCPVAYEGNPKEYVNQMTPDQFRNIIHQIHINKGGIVSEAFNGIYMSHYNEMLLWRYLEEGLQILREYKMGVMVLTNGTTLVPKKVDMLNNYQDVLYGICINAPIWTDRDLFAKRVNMRPKLFDRLVENVDYAYANYKNKNSLSIQINGHDRESGAIKGPKFPKDLDPFELDRQVAAARQRYPDINVFKQPHLIDRVGLIDDYISSEPFIKKGAEVIGCNGKRDTEWLHINANADLFLCCNDYHMEYKYGNLNHQDLKDAWMSPKHKMVMKHAFGEICQQCTSAVFA
tara:strand:- start:98 stop:1021 length:924 start_codon:yes stop_codon:yes gene_type:complete